MQKNDLGKLSKIMLPTQQQNQPYKVCMALESICIPGRFTDVNQMDSA
jgi:hypothetical protein